MPQQNACNLSLGEGEAGRSGVQDQLGLHETRLQREKMTWAEAMAQQEKRSPYKHDDWSSRPQRPHRNA